MANPTFHQYDPAKTIFSWSLLPGLFTGYAEGEFIKFMRAGKLWISKGGADGETTRVQNRDRRGIIQITLKQGSTTNAMLSAILQADENSGTGVAPGSLVDMSGTTPQTVFGAANVWIEGWPEAGFMAQDEATRIWTFNTDASEIFLGGN